MVLSWKQFSSPGTPCVEEVEPTAMTILSYLCAASVKGMRDMSDERNVYVVLAPVRIHGFHL